jgi:hypothetical protein
MQSLPYTSRKYAWMCPDQVADSWHVKTCLLLNTYELIEFLSFGFKDKTSLLLRMVDVYVARVVHCPMRQLYRTKPISKSKYKH